MKYRIVASLAFFALNVATFNSTAIAFHEGGVGYCDGCHTLHGTETTSSSGQTNSALLKGSNPSSTCLGCHAESNHEYSIFNEISPAQTAGGDFSWLKTPNGQSESSGKRGHNVLSTDFGLNEDGNYQFAPGGDYPSASLQCISCHDPHGIIPDTTNSAAISGSGSFGDAPPDEESQLGNFRLLGGVGYIDSGQSTGFVFAAPVAVASSAESGQETDSNHTAYGKGMSEWCTNCHAGMMDGSTGSGSAKHPAGTNAKLTDQMIMRYNSYMTSGNLTGTQVGSYSALVPFEIGTDDISQLDPSSTAGPDSNSNVMCLTCHRAHASAFENIGRWDFKTTLIASTYQKAGYYGRSIGSDFGSYQRQFCTKCHPFD